MKWNSEPLNISSVIRFNEELGTHWYRICSTSRCPIWWLFKPKTPLIGGKKRAVQGALTRARQRALTPPEQLDGGLATAVAIFHITGIISQVLLLQGVDGQRNGHLLLSQMLLDHPAKQATKHTEWHFSSTWIEDSGQEESSSLCYI